MKIDPSLLTAEIAKCYGGAWVACDFTTGYLLGVCRKGDLYTGLAFFVGGDEFSIGTKPFADPESAMSAIRAMALEWQSKDAIEAWKEIVKQVTERN